MSKSRSYEAVADHIHVTHACRVGSEVGDYIQRVRVVEIHLGGREGGREVGRDGRSEGGSEGERGGEGGSGREGGRRIINLSINVSTAHVIFRGLQ